MWDDVRTRGVGRENEESWVSAQAASFFGACHRNGGRTRTLWPGPSTTLGTLCGEALSVLDVAFVAAECFPPRRSWGIEGAQLDELPVSTFLAPLLDADLRAQPHLHLHATDAGPAGAGACSTLASLELWTLFYDSSEKTGCSVRLDWSTGSTRQSFEIRERRWLDW